MESQKISFDDFKNIIVERLGCEPEQVTMDASFQEDLNADSLDLVELIYAFEENTGLEIPDEDADQGTERHAHRASHHVQGHAGVAPAIGQDRAHVEGAEGVEGARPEPCARRHHDQRRKARRETER